MTDFAHFPRPGENDPYGSTVNILTSKYLVLKWERRGRRWSALEREFQLAAHQFLRWGTHNLELILQPSNLPQLGLPFLPFQSPLHLSSPHTLFLSTKLHSIARRLLQTGACVEDANVGAPSSQSVSFSSLIGELLDACQHCPSVQCPWFLYMYNRFCIFSYDNHQ